MTPNPPISAAPRPPGSVLVLTVALVAAVVCGVIGAYISYNVGYDKASILLQARLDEQTRALEKVQAQKPKRKGDTAPPITPSTFSATDLPIAGLADLPPQRRDDVVSVFNTIVGPCEPCVETGQSFATCLKDRPTCWNMPVLAGRAIRLAREGKDRGTISDALTFERPWTRVEPMASPSEGPEDAPVTIVEFTDFQCPYCARAQKTLAEIRARYGDQVRFVYKAYPLGTHRFARPAALAAVAAHDQGRFWEYKRLLFERQKELIHEGTLEEIAKEVGLDVPRWKKSMDEGLTSGKVTLDVQQAERLGVHSTPTFFVNGYRVKGARPLESFTRIIEAELSDLSAR